MSVKRNILTCVVLAAFCCLPAKNNRPVATGVSFSGVCIGLDQRGDSVVISFRASARKGAVDRKSSLVITPVFEQDGENRSVLRPIVVQGTKAALLQKRKKYFEGEFLYPEGSLVLKPGETINYKVSLFYKSWMSGASLAVSGIFANCCAEYEAFSSDILAKSDLAKENLELSVVLKPDSQQNNQIANERDSFDISTPEENQFVYEVSNQVLNSLLTQKQPAVMAGDESDRKKSDRMGGHVLAEYFQDNFPGSGKVIFRVNKSVIDVSLGDNMQVLAEIINAIKQLKGRISGVVVTGYASPEGAHENNMQLAMARANAVAGYINMKTDLPLNRIYALNGGIDYDDLRKLVVAGDMPDRDKVLYIIDNVPVWDDARQKGRKSELLKLKNGEAWDYMLKKYFPCLRAAGTVVIFYE